MVRGQEWTYVDELILGKHTSHIRCKSCGHTFHGNATRIKEHLFNVGVNVNGCPTPPGDIHSRLHKYVAKLKASGCQVKKKSPQGVRCEPYIECTTKSIHMEDEGVRNHGSPCAAQNSHAQSSHASPSLSGKANASTLRGSTKHPLQNAFDKQSMLELHLKWTRAFMACGISFNVIRNPIFKDALMSTAKKGFLMPDYNKMRT